MIRLLLLIVALVATPAPATAEQAMEAALRAHIAVLASDDYEGRKPGTAGETKAVSYIAAQLQAAGLRPGAADGGWYQRVELVSRTPIASRMTVTAGGGRATAGPDALVLVGREAATRVADAPIVWAGFARPAELAGVDLTGAVVLFRGDLPKGADAVAAGDRRQAIVDRGAAAVISLYGAESWARMEHQLRGGSDALAALPVPPLRGSASMAAGRAILAAAGAPDTLLASAEAAGFKAVRLAATAMVEATTAVRAYPSYNVIGMLPGRDAGGEAIAFTAHWDHLGLCRPAGAADRICNGAADNASGTAMLIETARGLAADPPQRDVLFVATTAEEMGLLGAEAFAIDPPRPLRRIVAALNLDTGAITGAGAPVAIIGRGITPSLDRVVDDVAAAIGRKVDRDTEANALVQRQDGWAMGKRGLASVMIGGSFSDMGVLQRYLGGDYHSPTDDLAHLPPLAGAAEDVALHVAVGRALGDRGRYTAR